MKKLARNITKPARVKTLTLHTTQGDAGTLHRESQFVVRYNDEALKGQELAISLTMPPRPDGWISNQIPPILAMNLPEGFLLQRVHERYRKVMDIDDDMNLLAVTSTPTAGRVWASTAEKNEEGLPEAISLRDILVHKGAEELFDELLERFATASISGVQPKVVVPEKQNGPDIDVATASDLVEKSSIKSPDLIVKAAGDDYPDLAENEYICMSLAKHVGLVTPEFWLSDDRKLFVIRRFDVGPRGYLGFEDMAVLMGKHPSKKYEGSYADVARAIGDFAGLAHRNASIDAFFRLTVLNCLIRNGDAHLKNFGILYGDPKSADDDARLAPVYDVVCTTVYIPKDVLALSLASSKLWPDRKTLERFGRDVCDLRNASAIIEELIERAADYKYENAEAKMWQRVRAQLQIGLGSIRSPKKFPLASQK